MNTKKRIASIAVLCATFLLFPKVNYLAVAAPDAVDCDAPQIVCVEGTLEQDSTWTAENVYVIEDELTIKSGVTLTIEAGTIIKARNHGLTIDGTLNTNGTASEPIIFTSLRDDSAGGDTDDNDSTPRSNDWDNLKFLSGSIGSLTHTELRYFGSATNRLGSIFNDGGTLTLDHVTLTKGQSSYAAITTNIENIPTVSNLTITEMAYSGLGIRGGALITDATIPNQDVIYYLVNDDLTVKSGAALTVEAGTLLKARSTELIIEGELTVNGTADTPVIFTSYNDDRFGGDSNSDGFKAIGRTSRYWDGISFSPNSRGALNGIIINRAYDGITTDAADLSIQDCVLAHNNIGLKVAENLPLPTITNCDIFNNSSDGIRSESTVILEAPNNWWGNSAGPDDNSDADGFENDNPAGQDVSNYINYATWAKAKLHPDLILSQTEIELSATANGNSPSIIPVELVAGSELTWQADATAAWVSASTAANALAIQLDTSTLLPGDYEAAAIAQWGDPAMPRYDIVDLDLRVLALENAAPELNLDATEIKLFGRETIQAPSPIALTLTNIGTGTLDWTATTDAPWLTITPSSGTADTKIQLTADINDLAEGVYKTEILIQSSNATNGPVTLNTSLTLGCSNPRPMDVSLVIDRSGSMSGRKLTAAKEAALSFVQLLDLTREQVAVVAFDDEATLPQALSQDSDAIAAAINALRSGGSTNISNAIQLGQSELRSERRVPANLPVMILLSDGADGRRSDAITESFLAKSAGTYVVTIGLGNADDETLAQIASFRSDYYAAPDERDLINIYNNVATTVSCNVSGTGVEQIYLPFTQK